MTYQYQQGDITTGTTAGGTPYEVYLARALDSTSASYEMRIIRPMTRSFDSTDPVLYYFRGRGGSYILDAPSMPDSFWQAWTDRNWLVVSPNGAGKSFGNPEMRTVIAAVHGYVNDNYNMPAAGVLACGLSMGGITGMSLILTGTLPILGFVSLSGLMDLRAAYDNPTLAPAVPDEIELAYGMATDGSDYTAKTATSGGGGGNADPMLRDAADLLANCTWYRFYVGASDTELPKEDHGEPMATKLAAATEKVVVQCSGGHTSADLYRTSDVLAFYDRVLDAFAVGVVPLGRSRIAAQAFAGLA